MSVSNQLRTAIRRSGKSANELAKEAKIPQPTITRFLNGADMKASTIDKLAEYFGLQLRPVKPRSPLAKPASKITATKIESKHRERFLPGRRRRP
jgi:hypothetical protein